RHERDVIVEHRRDDPGRTVGGGGDYPPAGGVLLVDGERVERDPFHGIERVGRVAGAFQRLVQAPGPAPDLQPAGQHPVRLAARPPAAGPPASAHSCITCQIRSRPARISASSLRAFSLASITPLIGRPVFPVWASSSAPVPNGYGTGVASASIRGAPSESSPRTKPPPME